MGYKGKHKMGITFTYSVRGSSLYVKSKGRDNNLENRKTYVMGIIKAGIENKCSQAFIDQREMVDDLQPIDIYELTKFISENIPLVERVCIISNKESLENSNLYKLLVENRGVKTKIFTDYEAGVEWFENSLD